MILFSSPHPFGMGFWELWAILFLGFVTVSAAASIVYTTLAMYKIVFETEEQEETVLLFDSQKAPGEQNKNPQFSASQHGLL